MVQLQHTLSVLADGPGLREVTAEVVAWLSDQCVRTGLLTIFIRHTSASLLIQENVAADVRRDLESFFDRLVPEDASLYRHTEEGPDDMPAHIKGALTQTHLQIPVANGELLLGRYQGIFLIEHRRHPRTRDLLLHLVGE